MDIPNEIDLQNMTLDELRALNRRVVDIIREKAQARNAAASKQLKVNDLVEFDTNRLPPVPAVIQGRIIKISKVTATVLPDGALPWRVSLSCLRPATEALPPRPDNIILHPSLLPKSEDYFPDVPRVSRKRRRQTKTGF